MSGEGQAGPGGEGESCPQQLQALDTDLEPGPSPSFSFRLSRPRSSGPSLSLSSKFGAQREQGEGPGMREGPAGMHGGGACPTLHPSTASRGPARTRSLSHPPVVKEGDTGVTRIQNILYKSYNEPAGGVLCTAVVIPEPAPPATGGTGRRPRQDTDREQERKGSTWGSEKVESALGGGPRPRLRQQGKGLAWAPGGSDRPPSPPCGNGNHLHYAPPPPAQTQAPQREACGILWGFPHLLAWPRGPRKEMGAVAVLPGGSCFLS